MSVLNVIFSVILLVAALALIVTVLLQNSDQWDRKTLLIRVSAHCLTLYAAVAGTGRLLGWYADAESFAAVSVVFFAVYAFVWLASHWLDKQDEKKINQALDGIRDSE